jgi:hypothetical protein
MPTRVDRMGYVCRMWKNISAVIFRGSFRMGAPTVCLNMSLLMSHGDCDQFEYLKPAQFQLRSSGEMHI